LLEYEKEIPDIGTIRQELDAGFDWHVAENPSLFKGAFNRLENDSSSDDVSSIYHCKLLNNPASTMSR